MCDVCHQYPCHPSCPNAPEPPAVEDCMGCNEAIRVGDEYYEIDGYAYCDDCISSTWFEEDDKEETTCACCGDTINYGDECYKGDGKYYCNDCVTRRVAENDDY